MINLRVYDFDIHIGRGDEVNRILGKGYLAAIRRTLSDYSEKSILRVVASTN